MLRHYTENGGDSETNYLSPNDEEYLNTTKANKSGINNGHNVASARFKSSDSGHEQQKTQLKSLQDKIQKAHSIITKYTRIQSQVQKYNAYLTDPTEEDTKVSTENVNTDNTTLEQKINNLCSNNKSLLHKNIELKQHNISLQKQLHESREETKELNELDNEYNSVINDLEKQLNILNDTVIDKDETIESLNEKIEGLMSELTTTTTNETTNEYKLRIIHNDDDIERHSNSNSLTYISPNSCSDHKKNKVSDPEIDGSVFQSDDNNDEKKVRFGFGIPGIDNLKLKIIEDLTAPMDSPLGTPLASIAEQHSLKTMASQEKMEMQLTLYNEREKQWRAERNHLEEEIDSLNAQLKSLKKELKCKQHVHDDHVQHNNVDSDRLKVYRQNNGDDIEVSIVSSGAEDNNENAPLINDDNDDRQQKGEGEDESSTVTNQGNYGCIMCGYRLW